MSSNLSPETQELDLSNEEQSALFSSRILVVDDSMLIRELIGACLKAGGYQNVQFAVNGLEALEMIEEEIPDLIILDLEMPKMDGFEVCKKLRANPQTRNIPVLIESGRDTAADITKAFEFGASDMVVKPIKKYEILARTKVHLENKIYIARLQSFHDRVASELEQARKLQLDICPQQNDLKDFAERYNLDLGWHYEPSSELGGDIGGILPINEHQIAFYVADFSGHGVAASLNTFRMQTWLASASDLYAHPDQLFNELNNFLNKNLSTGSYATMLYFCLDVKEGELTYAIAGSQPPLLQNPATGPNFEIMSASGLPLGLQSGWQYKSQTIPFGANCKVIAYSDALVEVEAEHGGFLGDEGLRDDLNRHWSADQSGNQILESLVTNFHKLTFGEQPDDLTIIYLENRNSDET
ncbi:PP2C family protein-serine/threonine phosphatase [Sneathiella limimaris]|uniref:PP2C family protein-serine/threonine phosphatase n=1 Tax=Sneathiella limimaris TaxID=1964213 RepID=UPI00146ABE6F|nr:fused response regulator/phosphatase [Sneathiella limimaris]